MTTSDPNRVLIFDTTLRDGEQSPGCSMTQPEKMRVAKALAELGVDVIEAGFPAASKGDWDSVNAIAREVQGPIIAGLARCHKDDITKSWAALKDAAKPRIHVFLATSAIHRQYKLNMAKDEIIRTAVEGVKFARDLCEDIEFSPEDASRTEPEFLAEVVSAVIAAGATTINIPDTVGYTVPEEFYDVFQYLKRNVSGIDKVVLSVHCHDDLGMAVANSLAAVRAGARQIECTINGIGERAGNCSLEEVVMAIRTRENQFKVHTGINTTKLYPTSRLVSQITGMAIPRNKAIIGENAFAHESGIHQHGMLRNSSTYEIMSPQDVGLTRTHLVLGKHSGRHAFRERVKELGFELRDAELNALFEKFKALADRKKELFDGDIEALVMQSGSDAPGPWQLLEVRVNTMPGQAQALVKLQHPERKQVEQAVTAVGPVDAVIKAIETATQRHPALCKFEVRSVSLGEDAQGEALITVEHEGRSYRGVGVSTDIIEAAARAFLEVVNRIETTRSTERRVVDNAVVSAI
ncbi:MAG TPA: 2-isopropylmalate synthase [Steroidobacteraceae bacterium]|nr:2-isopropylmalate synthase [Steroidobacteraceae bacterium]